MNCQQCQHEIKDGAKFCPLCGAQQHFAPSVNSTAQEETIVNASVGNTPIDKLVGRVLDNRYELVDKLGEGGMGAVYRARRLHIGDEAAVKILHEKFVDEPATVERFQREAKAAAMLQHPNVVTIYDFSAARGVGDESAPAYIVMELIRGESLRDLLQREGGLPTSRAVHLMREICAGVGAGHRRGVVHRDLKPDNVIVLSANSERETETVKVVDFGIAKLRDMTNAVQQPTLTQVGSVIGTPYYMSPEQCRGDSLDARSDVYALGALFYEMLTGAPPFTAPTVTGVIAKHLTEPPPPLPAKPDLSPQLAQVVQRALAKDPAQRQADALEFGKDLQQSLTASLPLPATMYSSAATVAATGDQFFRTGDAASAASVQPLANNVAGNTASHQAQQTHNPPSFTQHTNPTLPATYEAASKKSSGKMFLIATAFILLTAAIALGGAAYFYRDTLFGATNDNKNVANNNVNNNARPSPTANANRNQNENQNENQNQNQNTALDPQTEKTLKAEVKKSLDGWAAATRSMDIDEHMSFYADTLNTYYRTTNVSSDKVRGDRQRAFDKYSEMDVTLSNISIVLDETGKIATVTLDKAWVFSNSDDTSEGKVQQKLTLEKKDGGWYITGEQDLKVYYTSKGSDYGG